ncbi:unnamed protein product [Closterium sp. NIES-53]
MLLHNLSPFPLPPPFPTRRTGGEPRQRTSYFIRLCSALLLCASANPPRPTHPPPGALVEGPSNALHAAVAVGLPVPHHQPRAPPHVWHAHGPPGRGVPSRTTHPAGTVWDEWEES